MFGSRDRSAYKFEFVLNVTADDRIGHRRCSDRVNRYQRNGVPPNGTTSKCKTPLKKKRPQLGVN
jgi:hypothetical protein